jgi:hypothetical protein
MLVQGRRAFFVVYFLSKEDQQILKEIFRGYKILSKSKVCVTLFEMK